MSLAVFLVPFLPLFPYIPFATTNIAFWSWLGSIRWVHPMWNLVWYRAWLYTLKAPETYLLVHPKKESMTYIYFDTVYLTYSTQKAAFLGGKKAFQKKISQIWNSHTQKGKKTTVVSPGRCGAWARHWVAVAGPKGNLAFRGKMVRLILSWWVWSVGGRASLCEQWAAWGQGCSLSHLPFITLVTFLVLIK